MSAAWRREVYHCRARRQCAQYRRPVYREAVGPVHCAECKGEMEWQRTAALPGSESKEQKTVTTKTTKLTLQPPADRLTARVCAVCNKPKGTTAFRQDGGAFFAHPRCFARWRKAQAAAEAAPKLIRIPTRFFLDHEERGLPTPTVIRETKTHVYIAATDPAIGELLDDAKHYAHVNGPDMCPAGLIPAARALILALQKGGAE